MAANYYDKAKDRLPSFLSTGDDSNIYKLLQVIFTELDSFADLFQSIEDGHDIDEATGDGLDHMGAGINLQRNGLDDEDYRIEIKKQQALLRSDGTVNVMIDILQSQLGIDDITDISIVDEGNASVTVTVPVTAIFASYTSDELQNYQDLVDAILPAGVSATYNTTGTFMFNNAQYGFSDIAETAGGQLGGITT